MVGVRQVSGALAGNIATFVQQKDVLLTATALVVGVAFQDVIRSLVKDIISPPIDAYAYGLANGEWAITKPDIDIPGIDIGAPGTAKSRASAAATTTAPATAAAPGVITIRYGKFLQACLAFAITLVVAVEFVKWATRLVARVPLRT